MGLTTNLKVGIISKHKQGNMMNDTRTDEEKASALERAISICRGHGWSHCYGWVFMSPNGAKHDLSAANLARLPMVEKSGHFIVDVDSRV